MSVGEEHEVWVSRYRLRAGGVLNAVSARREFEGVLIRVGGGYGCIHPWPELGDPTVERCLEDLGGRRVWPIVRRALRCAEYDGVARVAGDSLFEEMEVPRSHATLARGAVADVEAAVAGGFEVVKLKMGRDVEGEFLFLREMMVAYPELRWRLDFNESLSFAEGENFLKRLTEAGCGAVDFIEDLCPFTEGGWGGLWERYGVRLAVDREGGPQRVAAQVVVVKPAVDEPFLLGEGAVVNGQGVVVTSYMDHPVGQAFAGWEAARMGLIFPGLVGLCGLQTHHLFEKDGFVEELGGWKPEFTVPGGTGLGFDDQLAGLRWVRL